MDSSLRTLKLVLDILGVSSDIETLDDRKRIQKAVYLGQLTGVDLGYRFGWYLMGPYSPALTRDYFELASASALEPDVSRNYRLKPAVVEKLSAIAPLFEVPSDVRLSQEQWLEVLASVHYLRRLAGRSGDATYHQISRQKSQLVPYVDQAYGALKAVGLLDDEVQPATA